MAAYTRVNLKSDVQDMAPQFGMEGIEARFARKNLEHRTPFGHTHSEH